MSQNAINHPRTVTCVKETRNTIFYHKDFTLNTAILYGLMEKMFTASSICPQSLLFISLAPIFSVLDVFCYGLNQCVGLFH